MKKYIALLFAFLAFAALVFSPNVAAQEVESAQASTPTIVAYDLPFPGILPDHSLYKLKVLRDKIMLWLTTNPKSKADLYLLLTDKGMLATAMLVDKNQIVLAKQTALKAEHNYTLLTQELYRFGEKPTAEYFVKLKTAAAKHQEVLGSLADRVSPEDATTFHVVIDFSKRNVQSIEEYQKKRLFEELPEDLLP